MRYKYLSLLSVSLLSFFPVLPLKAAPSNIFESSMSDEIVVNNRILAKVNGKVISVLDVMKKMDLSFYRQYPNLSHSNVARYQFYMNNWASVLMDMIDDELIVSDATEKKVEVSDGDIREEMEELFGPSVVLNIDKIGLTFEEAWELLKKELIVKRMTLFMVRSKANNEVNPKKIRQLYDEFVAKNTTEEEWRYRVMTIRSPDEEKSNSIASIAYKLLDEEKVPFEQIATKIAEKVEMDPSIVINISEEYQRKDKELSLAHKAILQTLNIGNHSSPIVQTTKKGSETINRIFYLTEKVAGTVTPFKEMETKLRREITQKAMAKENDLYLKKLRRHYGITEKYLRTMIPDKFEPFTLR